MYASKYFFIILFSFVLKTNTVFETDSYLNAHCEFSFQKAWNKTAEIRITLQYDED